MPPSLLCPGFDSQPYQPCDPARQNCHTRLVPDSSLYPLRISFGAADSPRPCLLYRRCGTVFYIQKQQQCMSSCKTK